MKRFQVACLMIVVAVTSAHPVFSHGGAQGSRPDKEHGREHQDHRKVKIKVTPKGFEPSTLRVHAGERLTLLITRKTDKTCVKEILIPSLGTKQDLPLNKTVRVYLGPQPAGRIAFACGMDMFKGEIIVQE